MPDAPTDHAASAVAQAGNTIESPRATPLVAVENLTIRFPVGRAGFWGNNIQFVHAVEDVTFDIQRGERSAWSGRAVPARPPSGARFCDASNRGRARFASTARTSRR